MLNILLDMKYIEEYYTILIDCTVLTVSFNLNLIPLVYVQNYCLRFTGQPKIAKFITQLYDWCYLYGELQAVEKKSLIQKSFI